MALSDEVAGITDKELIEVLERAYQSTVVPPCRVCGGALSIQSIGGGQPTVWACDPKEWPDDGEPFCKPGRSFIDDHYERSRWIDHRQGGDSRVMELIRRYQALITAVVAEAPSVAATPSAG